MIDFADARLKMVDSQVRTEDVTDLDVLRALLEVRREAFVPARLKKLAYIDDDLIVQDAAPDTLARYLMRAAPFARMVQAALIDKSAIVLDIGCGTGYSSAVLAQLANSVVALESDADLARRATDALAGLGVDNAAVVTGALAGGYPSEGPYDVIMLQGAVEEVPPGLLDQLKEGGRLVAVVGHGRSAPVLVFTRSDGDIGWNPVFDAYIPPLPGFAKPKVFVF